jgi:hypothetical protein
VHNQSVQKADMQQAKKIYTQAKARCVRSSSLGSKDE